MTSTLFEYIRGEFRRSSVNERLLTLVILLASPTLAHLFTPNVLHAQSNGAGPAALYYSYPYNIPAGSSALDLTVIGSFTTSGNTAFCFYTGFGNNAPIVVYVNASSGSVDLPIPTSAVQDIPASSFDSSGNFVVNYYVQASTTAACTGTADPKLSNTGSVYVSLPQVTQISGGFLPARNPNIAGTPAPRQIYLQGQYFVPNSPVVTFSGNGFTPFTAPATFVDQYSVKVAIPATIPNVASLNVQLCTNVAGNSYCDLQPPRSLSITPLASNPGTLTAAPNPTTPTTSVGLTAVFGSSSAATGIPSGAVTFSDGATTLGIATLALTSEALVASSTSQFSSYRTTTPSRALVADFNKDGLNDLLIVSPGSSFPLTVVLGIDNRGNFSDENAPGVSLGGIGVHPRSSVNLDGYFCNNTLDAAVADFNGDGYPDIAILCNRNNGTFTVTYVLLYLNNGDGSFPQSVSTVLSVPQTTLIAAGDFNKDGKVDFVVYGLSANGKKQAFTTYFGDGTGAFPTNLESTNNGSTGQELTAVDLNNDGYPDLILLDGDPTGQTRPPTPVNVYQNRGDGTFPPRPTYTRTVGDGSSASHILVFPGNFPNIVALSTSSASEADLLLNNKTSAIGFNNTAYTTPVPGLKSGALGDFNADGYPDLAVFDGTNISVYAGISAGIFGSALPGLTTAASNIQIIATDDTNTDGYADLLTLTPVDSSYNAAFITDYITSGTATATLPASTFSGGSHSVTATTPGTIVLAPGSASTTVQSNGPSDVLTLTATPQPTTYGSGTTYVLTGIIDTAAGTPQATGSVRFINASNTSLLGTAALAPVNATRSSASVNFGPLNAGTYSLIAAYLGDSNYPPSSFTPINFTVSKATPVVRYNPTPTTITTGTPLAASQLNATATFNSATLPGTFAYTNEANQPVNVGTLLPAGNNLIVATFTPTDTTNFVKSAKANTIHVQALATLSLTVSPTSPTTYASTGTETLFANVSPTFFTPSGSVEFFDGATSLGTKALFVSSGSSTASLTVGPLTPGTHSLTFVYTGDSNYASSTSAATSYTVNQTTPIVTYTLATPTIVYPAQVSAANLAATVANNVPGSFQYTDVNGTQVLPTTVFGAGTHTITATFTPTDNLSYGTASKTVTLTVTKYTPVITFAPNPANITFGTPLSAAQLDATEATGLAGTFVYRNAGGTIVSVGTILPAGANAITLTYTPTDTADATTPAPITRTITVAKGTPTVTYNPTPSSVASGTGLVASQLNATASFAGNAIPGTFAYTNGSGQPVTAGTVLPVGLNTITATFTPTDVTDLNTASLPATINVAGQASVFLSVTPTSPNTYSSTGTETVFATVSSASSPTPTGSVQFFDGTTSLGTKALFVSSGSSTAQLSVGPLAPGVHSLTAVYLGDSNYAGVTSTPTSYVVNQTTPTLTYTPAPAAITFGTALATSQLNAITNLVNGVAIPGTFAYTFGGTPVNTSTILPVGADTILATFTPTDNLTYTTAIRTATINVGQATPVLTYTPTPATITYGTSLVAGQLNATATFAGNTVPGTFAYTAAGKPVAVGTILPARANTITATFTPTDTVSFAINTATATINVGQATPVLTYTPTPATITYGTGLVATQLNATATFAGNTIPGTVAYTSAGKPIAAGTILPAGANLITATFTPTDAVTYALTTATATINVGTAAPTIIWTAPAAITAGTPLSATQLNANATGIGGISLPGTFTYTPPVNTILPVGPATLSATFVPTDAANYLTVTSTVPLTVQPAITSTTLTSSPNPSQFGQPVTFSVSVSSVYVQVPLTGTVNVYDGTTLIGSTALPNPSVTTSALSAGPHTITAVYAGTANFATSTSAAITQTIASATTTLVWPTPASIPYATKLSATQLNASVSSAFATTVPGTFTYTPAAGTLLNAGTQTLSVLFTPTDTVNFKTATSTVNLVVTRVNPTLAWTPPATFPAGTPLSATQLNATALDIAGATLPGVFTYTPAAGTILAPGAATLSATFVPTDTVDYNTTSISVPLTVDLAAPTVTVTSSANPSQFGQPVTLSIAVSSIYTGTPLTGTLKVFDGTTLIGSPTLTNGASTLPVPTFIAGVHTITATYSGSTNFAAATSAPLTQTVNAATSTITWPTPADIPYGTKLSATQLNATVSTAYATTVPGTFVYTPAAGTLLPAGAQTLSVTFTPTDTTSFKPVTSTVAINVGKIAPVITWAAPADIIAGTPISSTQLNATVAGIAGPLPGTFVYTPPSGTILAAGTQTLSTTFTPTDLANYTTATASVPLNVIGLSLTSLSFTTAVLGQAATTITVAGTGFASDAVVKVDGAAITTTYVSRTSLTALIPASIFLITHTIQVQVLDPTQSQTSNTLSILMSAPPISVVFQGPTTVAPAQQPTLTFTLAAAYPVPVTGTFTITFTPASGLPPGTDDPTIMFPNGKRTLDFVIPAKSTITPPVVLQTGSVAGTITVTLTLSVNGQTITPIPAVAPVVISSPPAVPGVTSVVLTRNGNTLTVSLFGYSNIRQVDHVTFHFIPTLGQQLKTTDITIDGATLFAPYFASPASIPVGGSFEYDQIFNLDQGASVVGEVQVNLFNSLGSSLTGTAQ